MPQAQFPSSVPPPRLAASFFRARNWNGLVWSIPPQILAPRLPRDRSAAERYAGTGGGPAYLKLAGHWFDRLATCSAPLSLQFHHHLVEFARELKRHLIHVAFDDRRAGVRAHVHRLVK